MEPRDRKKAVEEYAQRDVVGGIYEIANRVTGWRSEPRIAMEFRSIYNRMEFSKKVNSSFDLELQEQWEQYGGDAFELVELERLTLKPGQTRNEYAAELETLLELYSREAESQ